MEVVTLEDIKDQCEQAAFDVAKPDPTKFPRYKPGDVIDEEQSVRWNREEVERRMLAWNNEVLRLQSIRQEDHNKATSLAIDYIMQETGLNRKQAKAIQTFVYLKYHGYIPDYVEQLSLYVDLFNEVIEEGKI